MSLFLFLVTSSLFGTFSSHPPSWVLSRHILPLGYFLVTSSLLGTFSSHPPSWVLSRHILPLGYFLVTSPLFRTKPADPFFLQTHALFPQFLSTLCSCANEYSYVLLPHCNRHNSTSTTRQYKNKHLIIHFSYIYNICFKKNFYSIILNRDYFLSRAGIFLPFLLFHVWSEYPHPSLPFPVRTITRTRHAVQQQCARSRQVQ